MDPELYSVLYQWGSLALTTNSLPSLVLIPVYLAICGWRSVRAGVLRRSDWVLVAAVALLQVLLMPLITSERTSQINVFTLSWPVIGFLCGYGVWRLSGNRPLTNWPWFRFGLLVTTLILTVDIAYAFRLPLPPGRLWQLGGAGLVDALVLAPPFLTLVFHGFLDCKSPLVFCSKGCRDAKRCLYDQGRTLHGHSTPPTRYSPARRTIWSGMLAIIVFLAFAGLTQEKPAPTKLIPPIRMDELQHLVAKAAERYNIPTPTLRESDVNTVAFTQKSVDGHRVEIRLGRTFERNWPADKAAGLTEAVLMHELGHAILLEADRGFPASLVVLVYVMTLVPLLFVMPSRRSNVGCGLVILSVLVLLSRVFAFNPHEAIKWLVLGSVGVGFDWALFGAMGWCHFQRLRPILPSPTAFIGAGVTACAIFYLGMASIGSLNYEREFFADRIAVCEAGGQLVIQTLEFVHENKRVALVDRILDPFHPSLSARIARIHADYSPTDAESCKGIKADLGD